MCRFIQYAAFGTGTTAPSASQTSLDAQVGSRSADRGGFANSEDAGLDAGNNKIWYEATFTRVFNITSAVNATEWGLSAQSTGNLSVRDLFREDPNDPDSDPVAISLDDGDQLQLVVTLRVEATWEYESKSFVITGTAGNDSSGTHTGNATISSGSSATVASISGALSACWPGGASNSGYDQIQAYLADQSSVAKNQDFSGSPSSASLSAESYTPGDFHRDWSAQWTTSQANGGHYAWLAGSSSSVGGAGGSKGLRFILTSPAFLTKESTHRLTLTVRKAVSRI